MQFEENRFYKLSEVSQELGIPQTSLSRWARNGQIPARKLGRNWGLSGQAVKALIENGTSQKGKTVGKP